MSDRSKKELLKELEQLKLEHATLKKAYEKDVAELKKAEAGLRKSEEKYQQLFLDSPISLWEEDFSEVKNQIDTIKKANIRDLRTWFLKRPDLVKELAGKVKIVDINHATLKLYKAKSKDDFFRGIPSIFSKESYDSFVEALIVIAEGRQNVFVKNTHVALDGSLLHINLYWSVAPGFEDTYSRVLVSIVDNTEQILMERSLSASEEKHRRLFETMSQGIVYHEADGSIFSANPAAERILGISLDQMQGKTSMDPRWKMITENGEKVSGHDHPAMIALRTGKKFGPVTRGIFIPEQDKYLWLSITGTPLFNPDEDKPCQVYAVFDDMTLLKQKQDELKKQQKLIYTVLEKLPIGIAVNTIYPKENVELISDNFAKIYEVKKESLPSVSSFWEEVYEDKEFREKIRSKILSDIESGDPERMQWHDIPITRNGRIVKYVSAQTIPLKDHNVVISTVMDVTERKKTEKTKQVLLQIANEILHNFKLEDFIKAVEQQLSEIVDTTNFYIALYDSETGMFSAPFEKDEKDRIDSWLAKGSASGLVIDKKQSILLQKQDVLRLIETAEIEQTGSICECWLGAPLFKGTDVSGVIVVQSYDNPEAFDNNTKELFEYVSNQISMALERTRIFEDLVQAKNKAEESDRLKSAFLANMSHEIRTPMNGIMGFAQLLKNPHLSDEQQQKYIEIIDKSGVRMLSIINDIVDISRIEAGVMDVDLTESNINAQLDYIYSFFKPQTDAKQIQLILSKPLPEGQEIITTDREKLFAVLTNLVKNAIKYSKKGSIKYGCTRKGSFLEFFIKDTGIGIRKDRQQAVFERFVQADIEDTEARQGAGLGLAISKAYVEMLGGDIWVESEEGIGSTFYFTIPYNNTNQEIGISAKDKTDQKKRYKILIVDDDEMSALLLNQYVQSIGKHIFQAANGSEAVEISRQHPDIDLILMDLKMPGIDGVEAAKQIRTFNKDVVIIAQTAKALTSDRVHALEAGLNDFITKPISESDLLECIEKNL